MYAHGQPLGLTGYKDSERLSVGNWRRDDGKSIMFSLNRFERHQLVSSVQHSVWILQ